METTEKETPKSTWGGAREGAGRKKLVEGGKTRTIYCTEEEKALAQKFLRMLRECPPEERESIIQKLAKW